MYHKTLFVHIPKTGGQSIEEAFLKDIDPCLTWEEHRRLLLCMPRMREPEKWPGPSRLAHLKARDYFELGYLPRTYFDNLFKFSLVRNPFSKVESHYFYGFSEKYDFTTFVSQVIPEAARNYPFLAPQCDYLLDDAGTMLVDATYRLENLAQAWVEICNRTTLSAALPCRNVSAKPVPVRWSAEMIKIIRECYKRDFDLLGYADTVC